MFNRLFQKNTLPHQQRIVSSSQVYRFPQRYLRIFFGIVESTQSFWNNVSQWTSENLDLTNITSFSLVLCLGCIDNISNLLLHHFLLIARHYIIQLQTTKYPSYATNVHSVIRSMEIEKQIAFDNNNLAVQDEMGYFQTYSIRDGKGTFSVIASTLWNNIYQIRTKTC